MTYPTVEAYISKIDQQEREYEERHSDALSDVQRAFARGPRASNCLVPYYGEQWTLPRVFADAFAAGEESEWLVKLLEICQHASTEGPEAVGNMVKHWMAGVAEDIATQHAEGA